MNGINYLLDTNFILGLLQSNPDTLALINARQIETNQCAYSAITRMELLTFDRPLKSVFDDEVGASAAKLD